MWPFKKKTEIEKVFDQYSKDQANLFLWYMAEYLRILSVPMPEDEQKQEMNKLIQDIINKHGIPFLESFQKFKKMNDHNGKLIQELISDERFIQNKKRYEQHILNRHKKNSIQADKSQLLKLCMSICDQILINKEIFEPIISKQIDSAKESDITPPTRKIAYRFVFNAIQIELCENDYREDNTTLTSSGILLQKKLKDTADNMFMEGFANREMHDEMLGNALSAINKANELKNYIDEQKKLGVPVCTFETDEEKKIYEMRTGKKPICLPNQKLKAYLLEAENYIKNEKFHEAIYIYKKCIEMNPVSKKAHIGILNALANVQKYDEMQPHFATLDGLLQTEQEIAFYYRMRGLYEKNIGQAYIAYACFKFSRRFERDFYKQSELSGLLLEIKLNSDTDLSTKPSTVLLQNNIPVYDFIENRKSISNTSEFWNKVKNCYISLKQLMIEEFVKSSAGYYPGLKWINNELCLDINANNDISMLVLTELLFFAKYVFRITFDEVYEIANMQQEIQLLSILNEGLDEMMTFNRNIYSERDKEYKLLSEDTIQVGYSIGCVLGNNHSEQRPLDHLREKAVNYLSDLFYVETKRMKAVTLSECINTVSTVEIDIKTMSQYLGLIKGPSFYKDHVYQAINELEKTKEVRNENVVKTEHVSTTNLSDSDWEMLYKTNYNAFWERVVKEYDGSKLPTEIRNIRDGSILYGENAKECYLSRLREVVSYNEWTVINRPEEIEIHWNLLSNIKKELQEKNPSERIYMLDVIKCYESRYIRY